MLAIDIFRERVTLRAEDGTTRVVPLEQLKTEVDAAPPPPPSPSSPPRPRRRRR